MVVVVMSVASCSIHLVSRISLCLLCLTTIPRIQTTRTLSFSPWVEHDHAVYSVQCYHRSYEYVHGTAILTCTQYNANKFYCWPPFRAHSKNRRVPIESSPFDWTHSSVMLLIRQNFLNSKLQNRRKRRDGKWFPISKNWLWQWQCFLFVFQWIIQTLGNDLIFVCFSFNTTKINLFLH